MSRETALLQYRADPTDRNFGRVAEAYEPWLRRTGFEALDRFSNLSPSADLDDLRVEGLLAISRSARRFVWMCPVCEETFLNRADLRAHGALAHHILGPLELVRIETFVEISARMAMRRAARRLLNPCEVLLEELPEQADEGQEERIIMADLLNAAERRLSGEALAILVRLLSGDAQPVRPRGGSFPRVPTVSRRLRTFISSNEGLKEVLMENEIAAVTPAPETGPRWKVLSLQTLREAAKEVLGIEVAERTVRGAYEEALRSLEGRELEYMCGRCGAPLDEKMPRCWACAASISDGNEEDEMRLEEIQARAKKLGIAITANNTRKTNEALLKEVEAAETRRRNLSARGADVTGMEAQKLNEAITVDLGLPDGWTKSASKQFTSYWDGEHVRRVSVMLRGFKVCFCVDDGFFGTDLPDGLAFYHPEERKRRHYGRDNYIYTGDVSKVALKLVDAVFKKYGKRAPLRGGKPGRTKK